LVIYLNRAQYSYPWNNCQNSSTEIGEGIRYLNGSREERGELETEQPRREKNSTIYQVSSELEEKRAEFINRVGHRSS